MSSRRACTRATYYAHAVGAPVALPSTVSEICTKRCAQSEVSSSKLLASNKTLPDTSASKVAHTPWCTAAHAGWYAYSRSGGIKPSSQAKGSSRKRCEACS
eukprot:4682159-Prorocentrum_lima.AAC.1